VANGADAKRVANGADAKRVANGTKRVANDAKGAESI
jgi:hypothetical protein